MTLHPSADSAHGGKRGVLDLICPLPAGLRRLKGKALITLIGHVIPHVQLGTLAA